MKKVVLILVDGMRPDSLALCGNPFVKEMEAHSVYTLKGQTVMPSVTLVTLDDGKPVECYVAVPLAPGEDDSPVVAAAKAMVGEDCRIVVNGTGRYVTHGSVGDCGTTGRKLVVDFYGGNSRIGGGSPWGKDPTKADVTLNIYARRCALEGMKRYGLPEMRCAISCCIGRRDIRVALFDGEMNLVEERVESDPASHVVELLGLDRPVYAETCARGLFGFETL